MPFRSQSVMSERRNRELISDDLTRDIVPGLFIRLPW
jgi:hypothetical protein